MGGVCRGSKSVSVATTPGHGAMYTSIATNLPEIAIVGSASLAGNVGSHTPGDQGKATAKPLHVPDCPIRGDVEYASGDG